nr:MAG TPA: hypothetical protein [Bacteriophage sp.]
MFLKDLGQNLGRKKELPEQPLNEKRLERG